MGRIICYFGYGYWRVRFSLFVDVLGLDWSRLWFGELGVVGGGWLVFIFYIMIWRV